MPAQSYLAIDLGAESGRVISGQYDGSRVELIEQNRFANRPVSIAGSLRWNVLGLWEGIQEGLAKAAAIPSEIVSMGVDTWGVDYVLLDKSGKC